MSTTTTDGTSRIREDALRAPPYPKPGDPKDNTGFNSLNMHEVLLTRRTPAVRTKLKMAGKPQAAQLADGTIVVAGFIEPPEHEKSCVTIQWSTDNAATFSEPKVFEDMPGRTCGLRCLSSGTLILGHGAACMSRSTDGGQSWTTTQLTEDITPESGQLGIGESDGAVELPDGTLLQHVHRFLGDYKWQSYLVRSTDEGRTWGDPTLAATGTDADEISYELLHSGRILGIGRCSGAFIKRNKLEDVIPGGRDAPLQGEPGDSPTQFHSDDGGQTWSDPMPTGLGVLQAATYPLQLRDGRVILVIGHRQLPFGVQAVASRDNGMTWDLEHPMILSQHSWSFYSGHPRSCQLQDGSVISGYYTHRMYAPCYPCPKCGDGSILPRHNNELTGELIRWWPPDDWP